ncbi:MAG: hypothetical protein Q8Q10_00020 [bacterium]|nr:hypothetical protein [bacterium]
MFGLSKKELAILQKLSTPDKIQDFLDRLPINHVKKGATCFSPRQVLREQKAHCIEGALLAAAALWLHGESPLLLDLKANKNDYDHVVALYKKNGYWGAISKTNHPVLCFRDPIYRTVRELALSYFHEYVLAKTGEKTLLSYSCPFSLKRFGTAWITAGDGVWDIAAALDDSRHFKLVPKKNAKFIRRASPLERKAGALSDWSKKNRRT